MQRNTLSILAGTLIAASAIAQQNYAPQPATRRSTLISAIGEEIPDTTVVSKLRSRLIANNAPAIRNATFLHAQCFSGGFLDNYAGSLSPLNWVAGSSARHDELAWGEKDGAKDPMGLWVRPLVDELKETQTTLKALQEAAKLDPYGPNGLKQEDPQYLGNNAQQMSVRDVQASNHVALLWAGDANAKRHYNNIERMVDVLADRWAGLGSVSVVILGEQAGFDPMPLNPTFLKATEANLMTAIDALPLNSNSQFLFFTTDHGGWQQGLALPKEIASGGVVEDYLDFTPGYAGSLLDTKENLANLKFTIKWENPIPQVRDGFEVRLDGVLLGTVMRNGDQAEYRLGVDETVLFRGVDPKQGFGKTLELTNLGGAFSIDSAYFSSGAINDLDADVVPEPATFVAATAGLVGVLMRRRRGSRR